MKRIAAVLAAILILVLAMAPMAFADELLTLTAAPVTSAAPVTLGSGSGLEYLGSIPKDGSKGKQPSNMAVKLQFAEDMSNEANDAANKALITISDPEGKTFDFTIAHSAKFPNELWLVLNGDLAADTEYTVVVKSGIRSTSGSTTGSEIKTTFRTRNTKKDSTISTVLMFAMFAGMFAFSTISARKQAQAEDPVYQAKKAETLNPYKIAKEKKISLEEAKAYCEKERAKAQKALAKAEEEKAKAEAQRQKEIAEAQARLEAEAEAVHLESVYRVKGPKSIKEVGASVPKSVREARRAREEAAQAAERARQENAKGRKSKK